MVAAWHRHFVMKLQAQGFVIDVTRLRLAFKTCVVQILPELLPHVTSQDLCADFSALPDLSCSKSSQS